MSEAATRDTAAASAAIAEEQARRVTEIAAASDAADAAAVQERRESIAAADAAMTEEQARRVKELADGEAASAVAEAEERAEATAEAIDAAERTRAASLAADAEIDAATEAERCVPLSLARVRTAPCSFTACAHTTPSTTHTHAAFRPTPCLAASSPLYFSLLSTIYSLRPSSRSSEPHTLCNNFCAQGRQRCQGGRRHRSGARATYIDHCPRQTSRLVAGRDQGEGGEVRCMRNACVCGDAVLLKYTRRAHAASFARGKWRERGGRKENASSEVDLRRRDAW